MACTACHEAWPKLNAQGWAFRDNGYQWMAGKDDPITLNPAYWPVALRDTIGYQYQNTSNVPVPQPNGSTIGITNSFGQIGITNIDLLFAGTLARNISFLIVIEPFLTNSGFTPEYPSAQAVITAPGQPGYVESAWVRFDNIMGTPFLNFKIGKGSLDVAFDEHRSMFIFNNAYAMYHYQPPGSLDPFGLGDNQWQASIEGHNVGSSFRYAVSLVETENSPGTGNIISSAGWYGHIQQAIFPASNGIAEARLGLFGSVTSYPTMALYSDGTGNGPVTTAGAPVVPYTGYNNGLGYRAGVDLSIWFHTLATPLNLRLAGVYGNEDSKFFQGIPNVQNASWFGQLIELDWTPIINFTTALRWDGAQNMQCPDPTQPCGLGSAGQTETQVLAFRYTFEIIPRTAQTLHFEFGHNITWGSGANGLNQTNWNAFGGLDFAF
jgi:hypothetical protein